MPRLCKPPRGSQPSEVRPEPEALQADPRCAEAVMPFTSTSLNDLLPAFAPHAQLADQAARSSRPVPYLSDPAFTALLDEIMDWRGSCG